jgi:hypothetical protein
MPYVNEKQGGHRDGWDCSSPLYAREKPSRQLVERAPRLEAAPRVAVAGQIDQIERRGGTAGDAVHVREPRLARRGARASDARPDERVDQTRFPDVRTPDEGQLGETVSRQLRRARGASDEGRFDLQ